MLGVFVTAANLDDREGLLGVIEKAKSVLSRVQIIWADAGYQGSALKSYSEKYGKHLEVVKRPQARVRI